MSNFVAVKPILGMVSVIRSEALKPLSATKYVIASDDNFQIIRDTAQALNLDLSKIK